MSWWYAVVEAEHEIQNPTSPDKILRVGELLGLGATSHVLDIAAGRGGPALLLAERFGCRLTCVERSPEFVAAARDRASAAGLDDRLAIVEADAAEYELDRYDAALCLGATFVYGGLVPTLERLSAVAPAIAVGEPYWRVWPPPARAEERDGLLPLDETVARAESTGVSVVDAILASEEDWDRHLALREQTLERWLAANPEHPRAEDFRARGDAYRASYDSWQRASLGWAILVCRT